VIVVKVRLQGFAAERKGERDEMCLCCVIVVKGFAAERKGERDEMCL